MADAPFEPGDGAMPADDRVDGRLRDLAGHVRFVPTPDLAGSTGRLIADHAHRGDDRRQPQVSRGYHGWGRFAAAALMLCLIAAGVLAVSASARDTVDRWFDIPGVRLLFGDDEEPSDAPVPLRSWLGLAMPLDEIASDYPFDVLLPAGSTLGTPDETYLLVGDGMQAVSAIYLSSEQIPAIGGSDVGVLITQFPAEPDSVWLQKELGAGNGMSIVTVNGQDALWIEGAHNLMVLSGDEWTPQARASANVLLWNIGGITFRIEASLPRQTMIDIAESLEPVTR